MLIKFDYKNFLNEFKFLSIYAFRNLCNIHNFFIEFFYFFLNLN